MKLVTCPETAHLEGIECEVASNGDIVRVLRCSRFDPPDAVSCVGECAARLNAKRARARAETAKGAGAPGVTEPSRAAADRYAPVTVDRMADADVCSIRSILERAARVGRR
jgi:hypothetical protein